MKLYEVPRHTKVKLLDKNIYTPPYSEALKQNQIVYFDHLDGMYSYCLNEDKNIVHPSICTEVEIVE